MSGYTGQNVPDYTRKDVYYDIGNTSGKFLKIWAGQTGQQCSLLLGETSHISSARAPTFPGEWFCVENC